MGTIKDLLSESGKADVLSIYLSFCTTFFSEKDSWPGGTGPILDASLTPVALVGFLSIKWKDSQH